jgi:hypothetical protein
MTRQWASWSLLVALRRQLVLERLQQQVLGMLVVLHQQQVPEQRHPVSLVIRLGVLLPQARSDMDG